MSRNLSPRPGMLGSVFHTCVHFWFLGVCSFRHIVQWGFVEKNQNGSTNQITISVRARTDPKPSLEEGDSQREILRHVFCDKQQGEDAAGTKERYRKSRE